MCECDIGTIRHASPTTSARVCACVVRCSLFVVHDVVVRLDDDKNTRHRRSKSMLACNILEKEKKDLIPRLLLVSLDIATRIGTRNPSPANSGHVDSVQTCA